ncbi:MAG: hypothetical protein P8186_00290 [Anaerolineae bacterium]|jgi:predicted metal-dependent phosphotriesterase family hydrolase
MTGVLLRQNWLTIGRLAGARSLIVNVTDIAEAKMWSRMGNGPGLPDFITQIIPRLEALGFEPDTIRRLVGENITCCLALPKDSVSRGA